MFSLLLKDLISDFYLSWFRCESCKRSVGVLHTASKIQYDIVCLFISDIVDWVVKEIYYLEEEMDTSEGWKVLLFLFRQNLLIFIVI